MAVFLVQSGFSLFFHQSNSPEDNMIDIVFRTTSAGIFGYFLSGNFNKNEKRNKSSVSNTFNRNLPKTIRSNNLSEISPDALLPVKEDSEVLADSCNLPCKVKDSEDADYHKIIDEQIIIATIIGISSLALLIIVRYCIPITPEIIGTISQMRDFVSGCVGFLIGTPLNSDADSKTNHK